MSFNIIETGISDIKIIEPRLFGDERGYFMEAWNAQEFKNLLSLDIKFVQDNQSRSKKGVVRGLHYQVEPHAQAKLVRCIQGCIFDVAVDIRKSSKTFGKWVGVELSSENKRQLWIPEGFAHGFVALSDIAEVLYKTNEFWYPSCERSIRWNDPTLSINWPISNTNLCLSDKDLISPSFKDAIYFS